MARPIWLLSMLLVSVDLVTIGDSRAADADPGKTVALLMLNQGWAKTKSAKTLVKQQNLNDPALKDDLRVRAAHWLTLMFQDEHDLALDSVKVHLAKYPTSVDPLRAEIWMRMKNQDYGKAIQAAHKLGEAAAPQQGKEQSPAEAAATASAIVFLGHVAGFLEGPANKANDAERRKFEAELLARLSNDQKEIFRGAKQDVLSQFQGMREQAGDFKQEAKQEAEAAKQDKLGAAKKKAEELDQAKAKADAEAQKAKDDLKKKQADLERQDAPLQQNWQRLKFQEKQQDDFIKQQQDQVNRLEKEAADPKNPGQQNALNAARAAKNQIDNARVQLAITKNDILRVEAEHQRLVEQGLMNQWQNQNQGQQLQEQQRALDLKKKQNLKEQRRVEEGRAQADADAQALARKAALLNNEAVAFTTYDKFPFDELRTRLLRKLAPTPK